MSDKVDWRREYNLARTSLYDLVQSTGPAPWASALLFDFADESVHCRNDKELTELAQKYWQKVHDHELH